MFMKILCTLVFAMINCAVMYYKVKIANDMNPSCYKNDRDEAW